MVNRNDDTVTAVLVGGRTVLADGRLSDLVGAQRTGRFLRAAHKAPALPIEKDEFAGVS
jgi:N-acyl-D-aspartate/D-glutamate deacylase